MMSKSLWKAFAADSVDHGEPEPDGDRVDLVDRLRSVRGFLQDDLAQCECQVGNWPVVGFEEAEQLWIGRCAIGLNIRETSMDPNWARRCR